MVAGELATSPAPVVGRRPPPRSRPGSPVVAALAVAGAALIAVAASRLGMVQFPGYDGSIVMNAAWQLHLGYSMYDGVVSGFPPLFLLGAKWSFELLGAQWRSLVIVNAAFSAVTYLAMVFLLRRIRLNTTFSLLIPAAVQAATTLTIGFWWYNQTTAVAGCLFLMAAVSFVHDPDQRVEAAALVGTAALLGLGKPNVAAPALLGVAAVYAAMPGLRRRGLVLLAVAGVVDLTVLLLARVDLAAMISSYLTSGTRVMEPRTWRLFVLENDAFEARRTWLILGVAVAGGAAALVSSWRWRRRSVASVGPVLAIALLGLPLALIGMATNNDYNAVDASIALAGLALVVVHLSRSVPARVLLGLALVLFLAVGVSDAKSRVRVRSAGPGLFYEDAPLTRLHDPPALDGLRVGPRLQAVISDLGHVLPAGDGTVPGPPVFFGPRIDFAYTAFGIRPPPGLPLYWEPFKDGQRQSDAMVDRFERARFAVCVFLTGDYTFLPSRLRDDITAQFEPKTVGQLTVWTRRPPPS